GSSCVVVLPRTLDFGLVPQGMSATRRVDLLNRCGQDVSVTDLATSTTSGGFFSLGQSDAVIPIPAGGSAIAKVTFTPKPSSTSSAGVLTLKVRMGNSVMNDA